MTERIDMGGAIVLLFTTGSLWHWEVEGMRETGSSDTRDAALFWAGWWLARRQARANVEAALTGGIAKAGATS
mgnify:CR=1 FL=1